jgi:CIC family chloride channel protein
MADEQSVSQVEVREFVQTQVIRKRLLPRAVLVGLISGGVATLFRVLLQLIEEARNSLIGMLPHTSLAVFAVSGCVGALGCYVALKLGKLDRDAGGSGIPQMKAVLEGHMKMNWRRLLWVKFLGALSSLGSGMAMGREGPTVQMGGAIGQGLAEVSKATVREKKALMAAGSGAGLAAAFNAPLAGVTFVLEELQRDFQPVVFAAALLCAATASIVSRMVSGQFPVFSVPPVEAPPLTSLPLFLVIGVLGGVIGVLFNKVLLGVQARMMNVRKKHPMLIVVIIGLILGLAAVVSPELLGGGHLLSEQAIFGKLSLVFAIELLIIRFVLIHLCYGSGTPGGIFAPLLSLGALTGLIAFRLAGLFGDVSSIAVAACAVAGMCAMFSGIVRAPLTGVVLIGEMTGGFDMMLPLLVASFTAYIVAESLRDTPIYEALLQRIAVQRGFDYDEEERQFIELEIKPGSPLIGIALKDAGLPPGALIVLCSLGGNDFVPYGDTTLEAHTKISVVATSAEAIQQLEQLVKGENT